MINKKNKFKQYESEFEKYKKEYSQKTVPKKLSKKASESWCNNAWLYKNKHGTLKISGAGRVLLWIVHTNNGIDKHLAKLLKTNQHSVYFECQQFLFRQEIFGLDLFKKNAIDVKNILKD